MKTFSDGTPVPMKLYSDGLPVEEMTREELCAALLIVVQERDQARDEAYRANKDLAETWRNAAARTRVDQPSRPAVDHMERIGSGKTPIS